MNNLYNHFSFISYDNFNRSVGIVMCCRIIGGLVHIIIGVYLIIIRIIVSIVGFFQDCKLFVIQI